MRATSITSKAKVTVGIATYNRADRLRPTVESVLAQSFGDFRLVISDNASDDNTAEVVASIDDERLDYCRADVNVGARGNFNRLIGLAETEFLMLLPDDDVLYPEYLARVVAALERYPSAGIAHTAYDEIDAESKIIRPDVRIVDSDRGVLLESGDEFIARTMMGISMIFSSATYRTRAIVAAGGMREEEEPFAEVPMWLRIALNWDVVFVAQPLAGFRIHDETITKGLVTVDGEQLSAEEQLATFTQIFYDRRTGFLADAGLPDARTRRYWSLATLRHLADRGGQGAPWTETTRGLFGLLWRRPRILLHPTSWRLIGAQLGGRQLRHATRKLAARRT
jgi:hypothetical protein